jgi:hypothetical protein
MKQCAIKRPLSIRMPIHRILTTFGGLVAGGFGASRGLLVGGLAGSFFFGILWSMFSLAASLPPVVLVGARGIVVVFGGASTNA